MIHKKTTQTEIKALWFATSILSSLWFLYWIFYDVYVWNKALIQVRPQNYVALIICIASAILSTQLEKTGITEKPSLV